MRESKFKKYVGQTIGRLEILELLPDRNNDKTWFSCKCKCGTIVKANASKLVRGVLNGCQKCKNRGEENAKWKGYKEIPGSYMNNIRNCAATRKGDKSEFTVTIEYLWSIFLKQERKCALSRLAIAFAEDSYHRGTCSLDRIDSTKGYIEGNVQWVHKDVNKMKTDFAQDRFLELCKLINNNYETSNSS